jgi:hypothetical protein
MPERESHGEYLERIATSRNVKALRVKLADVTRDELSATIVRGDL